MNAKPFAERRAVHDRVRDRERLISLLPGGSRQRPIEVGSAAVIEPRVGSMNCPHCAGEYRIQEHEWAGPSLRRVDATCRHCSSPRTIWFRLVISEPN
jgi:hypothetical protein